MGQGTSLLDEAAETWIQWADYRFGGQSKTALEIANAMVGCFSMRLPNSCLVALVFATSSLYSQETLATSQLKQMLDVSQRRGQLETEGAAPFHLKASFEWFDSSGKSIGNGTLDKLWETPNRYRESLNFSDKKLLEVDNGKQSWRNGEWVIPNLVAMGMQFVLKPFSERPDGDRLSSEISPKEAANLDCIGTEPAFPDVSPNTRLALTTYCLAKGNHLLRLISRPNGIQIAFNDIAPFGKAYIARTVQVAIKGGGTLRLHVDQLEAATDFSSVEEPPVATAQVIPTHGPDIHRWSGELMHAQLLTKVSPQYPQAGMRGRVVLKVSIDKTGSVESVEVLSSDNQILKAPILTAVKQWKYRAAYQAGKVVDDTQTISFDYGRDVAE